MSPESITTIASMDSGQPLRGFRNDEFRHCEERSDEAILLTLPQDGLLRFARNDGEAGSATSSSTHPDAPARRRWNAATGPNSGPDWRESVGWKILLPPGSVVGLLGRSPPGR